MPRIWGQQQWQSFSMRLRRTKVCGLCRLIGEFRAEGLVHKTQRDIRSIQVNTQHLWMSQHSSVSHLGHRKQVRSVWLHVSQYQIPLVVLHLGYSSRTLPACQGSLSTAVTEFPGGMTVLCAPTMVTCSPGPIHDPHVLISVSFSSFPLCLLSPPHPCPWTALPMLDVSTFGCPTYLSLWLCRCLYYLIGTSSLLLSLHFLLAFWPGALSDTLRQQPLMNVKNKGKAYSILLNFSCHTLFMNITWFTVWRD